MTETMRQYDVVIAKLVGRSRPDEESLTDLLNERSRGGWQFQWMTPLSAARMLVVFHRDAE
jgi:hypothetical protein